MCFYKYCSVTGRPSTLISPCGEMTIKILDLQLNGAVEANTTSTARHLFLMLVTSIPLSYGSWSLVWRSFSVWLDPDPICNPCSFTQMHVPHNHLKQTGVPTENDFRQEALFVSAKKETGDSFFFVPVCWGTSHTYSSTNVKLMFSCSYGWASWSSDDPSTALKEGFSFRGAVACSWVENVVADSCWKVFP